MSQQTQALYEPFHILLASKEYYFEVKLMVGIEWSRTSVYGDICQFMKKL
jgi:hypothetical protein